MRPKTGITVKVVGVSLPPELARKARMEAVLLDTSRSALIAKLLEEYFERKANGKVNEYEKHQ